MIIKIGPPAEIRITTTGGISILRKIGFWCIRKSKSHWHMLEINGDVEAVDAVEGGERCQK